MDCHESSVLCPNGMLDCVTAIVMTGGTTHVPFWQDTVSRSTLGSAVQSLSHTPQCRTLVIVSTQSVPHNVSDSAHVGASEPPSIIPDAVLVPVPPAPVPPPTGTVFVGVSLHAGIIAAITMNSVIDDRYLALFMIRTSLVLLAVGIVIKSRAIHSAIEISGPRGSRFSIFCTGLACRYENCGVS